MGGLESERGRSFGVRPVSSRAGLGEQEMRPVRWSLASGRFGVGWGTPSGADPESGPDIVGGGAGVSSGQENGKVWSVASTVRFRVDRKDDGGIVICEAQNQALPSGHSKQTQYVLDVQCKCPAPGDGLKGREGPRSAAHPGRVPSPARSPDNHSLISLLPQTPPRPGSMPPKLWCGRETRWC